jgi:hypothetical protein
LHATWQIEPHASQSYIILWSLLFNPGLLNLTGKMICSTLFSHPNPLF